MMVFVRIPKPLYNTLCRSDQPFTIVEARTANGHLKTYKVAPDNRKRNKRSLVDEKAGHHSTYE